MRKQGELSVSSAAILGRVRARWKRGFLSPAADTAIAASAPDVAAMLLDYLDARLGVRNLAFIEKPAAFTDGWETYNYHFQLQSRDPLPAKFAQPLAVRIYCGPTALPRAKREFLVHCHLHQLNYPVPEPLFLEENCTYLDGPFLVMARVCGPTLLRALLRWPWKLFRAPVAMAEVQARLHQLPTSDFPAPAGCLLTRRLDEMATAIDDYDLTNLRPGFDWLVGNRPDPPANASILHLDFHPLNLVLDRKRSLVVLDWSEADVGDPHADIGTTAMFVDCPPPVEVTRLERLAILAGRCVFLSRYLRTYRRYLPLDEKKLSYYRALAAFRRLWNYGRWLRDGPQISGNKPSMLKCVTGDHRRELECYFQKWTGISIRL